MGWGLLCKECHWHLRFELFRLLHGLQTPRKAVKSPRKAENKLQRYSTSSSENGCLCRTHIIMRSVIWFELSDRRATPPNVVKEVTQNARSSPLRIWAWDQALHCKLEPIVAPPSQSSRAWGTPGATRAIVPARGVVLVFTAWMERGEGAGTSLFLTEPLNTT